MYVKEYILYLYNFFKTLTQHILVQNLSDIITQINSLKHLRLLHIYMAQCGAVRFILHAKQGNFLYLAHLGDFSQHFVSSKLTKYL